MNCAVCVGMIYVAILKESVVFVYYHGMIDGFLSALRHNQLSYYGWEFDNLWVTAITACHFSQLPEVIRVSVTSEEPQWHETRCRQCHHLSCVVTQATSTSAQLPWLSCLPSQTLLCKAQQEKPSFSPTGNSFRFCCHPHPFQMLKDWYWCDLN